MIVHIFRPLTAKSYCGLKRLRHGWPMIQPGDTASRMLGEQGAYWASDFCAKCLKRHELEAK